MVVKSFATILLVIHCFFHFCKSKFMLCANDALPKSQVTTVGLSVATAACKAVPWNFATIQKKILLLNR